MGLEPLDLDLRSVIMLVATFLEAMLPLLLEPFLAAMMTLRVRLLRKGYCNFKVESSDESNCRRGFNNE